MTHTPLNQVVEKVPFDSVLYTQNLVKNLNDEQARAVLQPRISSLVLAGAGAGKTTVIIGRIANLVNTGLPARKILAVTFTNKSSEEMRKRLDDRMAREDVNTIWMGTFHSLCNRILRENYDAAGLPRNFAILDTDSQTSLIKTITKDKNSAIVVTSSTSKKSTSEKDGEGESDGVEKINAKDVVNFINSKKEYGIQPHEVEAEPGTKLDLLVNLFGEYQQACIDQGLLDFSDLLYRTVALLESNELVRSKYHEKFDAILIDEFQDTNDIQYRWLKLMKGPQTFVMAVGDDDQSIYAFRGANPENLRTFVSDITVSPEYPQGNVIKLEQNYRSLPFILDAANAVIDTNTDRLGKNLWTAQPGRGEKITVTEYENGVAEARVVAKKVHTLIADRRVPPNEIAVMYRTNMQSRLIEQEVNKLGVPATVYGGFRFYERAEIKDVLAYMDLVSSFTRDISFTRVINLPVRGIGNSTVEDLRQEARTNGVSMVEMIGLRADRGLVGVTATAIKKQAALENFAIMIMDLTDESMLVPLSTLVSSILQRSGLEAHYNGLPEEESADRKENVAELMSAAKQFEIDRPELKTAAEQLPEYLTFVQLMTSTSKASMDQLNTVSLMSIHSAKGLEFNHVFLTGLEEGVFPHARSIGDNDGKEGAQSEFVDQEYDDEGNLTTECVARMEARLEAPENNIATREMQEECRLMYVAMTRPRLELDISYAKSRLTNGESKPQKPSRFLKLIPQNLMILIKDSTMRNGFGEFGGEKKQGTWNKYPGKKPPACLPVVTALELPPPPAKNLASEVVAPPEKAFMRRPLFRQL